jgi:cell division septum initiation protein DivIVA
MDQSPAQPAAVAVPELTGEEAHLVGEDSDLQAHAGFDGALRGYDRRQVNKYVTRTQKRLEDLTADLAAMRKKEQVLTTRVDDLTRSMAMCSCDPSKPESAVVGARLRQIIDIASVEADDLRNRAEGESVAMRDEAERLLATARQQAEQATSALEAMLAHRRAAEEAATAERRTALEGWADRHVSEARETARRVIERAGAASTQVISSARWLVDALGAHRDALAEQLGGVQRRIDELPSLEAAAAASGEKLATLPSEDQPVAMAAAVDRPVAPAPANGQPDEAGPTVRAVVRISGAHPPEDATPGGAAEGQGLDTTPAPPSPGIPPSPGSVVKPPAHAAPAETATLNRTWTPVNPRTGGGAHRG